MKLRSLVILVLLLPFSLGGEVINFLAVQKVLSPGLVEMNILVEITDSRYYIPYGSEFSFPLREGAEIVDFSGPAEYRIDENGDVVVRLTRSVEHSEPVLLRLLFRAPHVEFNGFTALYLPVCVGGDYVVSREGIYVAENLEREGNYYVYPDENYCIFPFVVVKFGDKPMGRMNCGGTVIVAPEDTLQELCHVFSRAQDLLGSVGVFVRADYLTLVPYVEERGDVLCYELEGNITCSSKLLLMREDPLSTAVHELVHVVQGSGPIWYLEGTAAALEDLLTVYDYEDVGECRKVLENNFWDCWEEEWWGSGCKIECNGYDTAYLGYSLSSALYKEGLDVRSIGRLVSILSRFYVLSPEDVILVSRLLGMEENVYRRYSVPYSREGLEELEDLYREVENSLRDFNIDDPLVLLDQRYYDLEEWLQNLESRVEGAKRIRAMLEQYRGLKVPCSDGFHEKYMGALNFLLDHPSSLLVDDTDSIEELLARLDEIERGSEIVREAISSLPFDVNGCYLPKEEVRRRSWNLALEYLLSLDLAGFARWVELSFAVEGDFRVTMTEENGEIVVIVSDPWSGESRVPV